MFAAQFVGDTYAYCSPYAPYVLRDIKTLYHVYVVVSMQKLRIALLLSWSCFSQLAHLLTYLHCLIALNALVGHQLVCVQSRLEERDADRIHPPL